MRLTLGDVQGAIVIRLAGDGAEQAETISKRDAATKTDDK
jgi:hypothetical protein